MYYIVQLPYKIYSAITVVLEETTEGWIYIKEAAKNTLVM